MTIVGEALRGGGSFSGIVPVVMKGVSIAVLVIATEGNLSFIYDVRKIFPVNYTRTFTNNQSPCDVCGAMEVLTLIMDREELSSYMEVLIYDLVEEILTCKHRGAVLEDGSFVYICDSDRRVGYEGNIIYREGEYGRIHVGDLHGATVYLPLSLISRLGGEVDRLEGMGYNVREKDEVMKMDKSFYDISIF